MAGTAPTAFSAAQPAPAPASPPGAAGAAPPAPPAPIDVAFVANTNTPYRTHLHRRVAREMPELRLWSLFTHEVGTSPWVDQSPPEIRPVMFGPGEDALKQDQPSRALHEWRKGGRVIEWLKEHQVRAVVVLGYNDAGRLRIVRWCAKAGVPCLMWADSNVHGDLAGGAKWLFKRLLLPRVLARCCALLPCGRLGREYFRKYGVDPGRTFFFPVEPDYDLIRNLPADRIEQAADRFGLKPGRRRIVFSGRLVHDKRVDIAIDAFAAIADKRPEWDLVIVGEGPLRAKLEARVPAPLAGRVIWTGFLADSADVSAVYRLSDVLILPSEYEPWALVINEAAAADLAIVSSSVVGAANELVREGVNGAIFPPGDLASATAALASVTDPQQIERLRAASRQVLHEWRTAGDPIKGLRAALRHCGVL
jgi:glycosyltransferase involved in cell wall biosynthesis